MEHETFSGFHPLVNLAFFVGVLGLTMFISHPVFLLISLISGCLYLYYLCGGRGFVRKVGYLLPFCLAMAILNPLFNHEGVTILWYLPNDNPITLEAIAYGLSAAVMMGAAIIWFNCCNAVFTTDKIVYLFGRVIPALSLLISMTLRFVPRFKNYLHSVWQVQKGLHEPKTNRERLRQALAAFSATVSWALEQAIVSADSMKSRGYGLPGRTAFSRYRFTLEDGCLMAETLGMSALTALCAIKGGFAYSYYPTADGLTVTPMGIIGLCAYGALCMLPTLITVGEEWKWKHLRSKA